MSTPRNCTATLILFVGLLVVAARHASAQGCAQCRDNTASTSPATQRAFRHSIEFMVAAAATFIGATFLVIRRTR